MKILDIRPLRGPNYWSVSWQKLVVLRLDLEETLTQVRGAEMAGAADEPRAVGELAPLRFCLGYQVGNVLPWRIRGHDDEEPSTQRSRRSNALHHAQYQHVRFGVAES